MLESGSRFERRSLIQLHTLYSAASVTLNPTSTYQAMAKVARGWCHNNTLRFQFKPCPEQAFLVGGRMLYGTILNTSAVSSTNLRVGTHLRKLHDTPAALFYRRSIL